MPHIGIPAHLSDYSPGARLFLGMAIGDAFGSRFENQNRSGISLTGEEETYRDQNRYTDDTQMAVAVSELLVSNVPFSRENLAQALLTVYNRDRRPGYSAMTEKMLQESGNGREFLCSLPEDIIMERRSDGAAMRALPLGFLPDLNEVIHHAALSARITHGHPDAVAATVGIALIAHHRYYHHDPFTHIIRSLPERVPFLTPAARSYLDRVISSGWDPQVILSEYEPYGVPYTESVILLGAVMAVLAEYGEDPHSSLIKAVSLGGDTDTTACIVLGAALIYPGNGIPYSLVTGLEDGRYGRKFLTEIGDALSERFGTEKPDHHPPILL